MESMSERLMSPIWRSKTHSHSYSVKLGSEDGQQVALEEASFYKKVAS